MVLEVVTADECIQVYGLTDSAATVLGTSAAVLQVLRVAVGFLQACSAVMPVA